MPRYKQLKGFQFAPLTPKLFVDDQSSCTKMPTRYQSLPTRYPPLKQMWQQNFPFIHFFGGGGYLKKSEGRTVRDGRRPFVSSPRAVFCAFRRFLRKYYALPGLIWHMFSVAVKLSFIALSFPCFFFFWIFFPGRFGFRFFFLVLFCFFEVVRGPRGNNSF